MVYTCKTIYSFASVLCVLIPWVAEARSAERPWVAEIRQNPAMASVQPYPGAKPEPAREAAKLQPAAVLRTKSEPAELRLTDGSTIRLDPDTAGRVLAGTDVMLEPGRSTQVSQLELLSGGVRTQLPSGAHALLIAAGSELAIFRGGRAHVVVQPDTFGFAVETGTGAMAIAGRWTDVPVGSYLIANRTHKKTSIQSLPAAPKFASEPCEASRGRICSIAVVVGDGSAQVAARWPAAVPGFGFRATLSSDPQGNNIIASQRGNGNITELVSPALREGTYWVTLRSVTPEGLESAAAIRTVRVVRLLLDPGIMHLPEQNVLLIPAGRGVRINSAAGLLIATRGTFAPAREIVSLDGDDQPSRTLRMCVDGELDVAQIALERRMLRADVEIDPKTAVWPRDPIHISVRISDPSGRVAPSTALPHVRVLVNGIAEPVSLVAAGDRWLGHIRTHHGSGPWVVRATVMDQDGVEIGYGMLEVISNHPATSLRTTASR